MVHCVGYFTAYHGRDAAALTQYTILGSVIGHSFTILYWQVQILARWCTL